MTPAAVAAYDAAAAAWAHGPERVYAALAAALLDRAPVPLHGLSIADVGAGTGVASRLLAARGARPYGIDVSLGMLRHGDSRPPGVVADARRLPFRPASLGGAVYAFSLNHVADPVAALREAARVVAPDGVVLASAFAASNSHPAKDEADAVLRAHGWVAPGWHGALKATAEPLLATPLRCYAAADAAGLRAVDVVETTVDTGVSSPADLAAWRLGMAAVAPYVSALPPAERTALVAAVEAAVTPEPLRPRVVLLAALA